MPFEPTTEFEDCSSGVGGISTDTELLCNQMQAVQLRQEEMLTHYFSITGIGEYTDGTPTWYLDYYQNVNLNGINTQLVPSSGLTWQNIQEIKDNTASISPQVQTFQKFVEFSLIIVCLYLAVKFFNSWWK